MMARSGVVEEVFVDGISEEVNLCPYVVVSSSKSLGELAKRSQ